MARKGETFMLTEQHVSLLRHMYVGWQDCETGAPEIDPKRPYGNSFVAGDVREILELEDVYPYDDDEDLSDTVIDALLALHRETENALQVVLSSGSFEPGEFRFNDEWEWERV